MQGEERLGLCRSRLAAEQDRFVPVGQVAVDRREHPSRRLMQPLGVHRSTGAGTRSRRLGHQPLLGGGHLLRSRLDGCLLGGVDDHAHLLQPELTGRERLTRRGVCVAQQPRDP
jgi:hypothetical protein